MEDTAIIQLTNATLSAAKTKATLSAAKPKGAKPKTEPTVQNFLDEGEALKAKLDSHRTETNRSNAALYALLAEVYAFALSVGDSLLHEVIVFRMEQALMRANIKVMENTPYMTLVVKYILRSDRQTAHTYSRALRVAQEEGIASADLVAFLTNAGGVNKVTMSKAEKAAAEAVRTTNAKRLTAYRQMVGWQVAAGAKTIPIDGSTLLRHTAVPEGVMPGAFVFLAAIEKSNQLHIAGSFTFTEAFEEGIFKEALKAIGETEEQMNEYAERLQRSVEKRRQKDLKSST